MSDDVFQHYSDYYDLLYRDKDYASEADYVAAALRAADPQARTVLEFGSGTGRHGRLLAQRGFDVTGIERSETMVTVARRLAAAGTSERGRFDCQMGDIRSSRLGGMFDTVISLFHVISYLTENADVSETFANAARHLRPGGAFLFDVWHGPAVLRERPSVRVKRVEDARLRLTRLAEPDLDTNVSVVTVKYSIFVEEKTGGQLTTFGEEHRMRYFFPPEIALFATQAGFDVARSEEFLTGKVVSESTWGVAYLLRKRT